MRNTEQSARDKEIFASLMEAEGERSSTRKLASIAVKFSFASIILNIIQAVIIGWLGHQVGNPDRQYFAVTETGSHIPMIPTNQPYVSDGQVVSYANKVLTNAFTFDFVNYRSQLEDVRKYFTTAGYNEFGKAMESSQILATAKKKRMVVTVMTETGIIEKQGDLNGTHIWYVQIPYTITMQNDRSKLSPQRFLATIRVTRIPTTENLRAIAIQQIVTKPMKK